MLKWFREKLRNFILGEDYLKTEIKDLIEYQIRFNPLVVEKVSYAVNELFNFAKDDAKDDKRLALDMYYARFNNRKYLQKCLYNAISSALVSERLSSVEEAREVLDAYICSEVFLDSIVKKLKNKQLY